ncbi:uncharacterized protein LOC127529429 [Erpetoichthys calabaricus]|uniref:uncharacterized protein LOC127529429 n=1 Tax=Erpetoichthys calabaricus TaxID=27687 RepID=UPI002234164D|nr:uncharacterized protein LOC127529429 [Erpetoichthys calabaricus]
MDGWVDLPPPPGPRLKAARLAVPSGLILFKAALKAPPPKNQDLLDRGHNSGQGGHFDPEVNGHGECFKISPDLKPENPNSQESWPHSGHTVRGGEEGGDISAPPPSRPPLSPQRHHAPVSDVWRSGGCSRWPVLPSRSPPDEHTEPSRAERSGAPESERRRQVESARQESQRSDRAEDDKSGGPLMLLAPVNTRRATHPSCVPSPTREQNDQRPEWRQHGGPDSPAVGRSDACLLRWRWPVVSASVHESVQLPVGHPAAAFRPLPHCQAEPHQQPCPVALLLADAQPLLGAAPALSAQGIPL